MTDEKCWLLPDGINEFLPDEAEHIEKIRRDLLDLYARWGYRLVMPPLVEYLDSLCTGTGTQLDLQTFKLTDQLTGRLMGVRADITPQVARIDAHRMRVNHPNRLCYMGTVLRTRSNHANGGSRSPMQVGAELFGHSGIESDFEVLSLMIETLHACGAREIVLDLAHIAVFRGVSRFIGLNKEEDALFTDMLSRKSIPEIESWLANSDLQSSHKKILRQLPELNGSPEILESAKKLLAGAGMFVVGALDYLEDLIKRLEDNYPEVNIHLDLAELRGYAYHTGIVYAVYLPGGGREVARGGRYDGIGKAFGNARPATGFSADLRLLAELDEDNPAWGSNAIHAPTDDDKELDMLITVLRGEGERVIRQLDQSDSETEYTPADMGCNRKIVKQDDSWIVVDI
jgi:ATP phosphoribosyltransferase regulatory subunit